MVTASSFVIVLSSCGEVRTPREAETNDAGQVPAAAALGTMMETQSDFLARCTRELVETNPEAQRWAADACGQNWETVVAAGPMAEAILAAAPATATPVDPTALPGRLPTIEWLAIPEGTLVAQGRLGGVEVQLESAPRLSFYWGETGQLIPYDVVEALRGRSAAVTLIGCMSFGAGEAFRVFQIEVPGRAPFALGVYSRMAPTADASSFYNVTLELTGEVTTLDQLRARDGDDWAAACAS